MDQVVTEWLDAGMPQDHTGVPHEVKAHLLQALAILHGLKAFVETGTCHGDMVAAMVETRLFNRIDTIEMWEPSYELARVRLALHREVTVHLGDSAEVLARVIGLLSQPALVFLDAHYSGGGTARGAVDTPIWAELEILAYSRYPNVTVIDDARLFEGEPFHTEEFKDYPSLESIQKYVSRRFLVPSEVTRYADQFIIAPEVTS